MPRTNRNRLHSVVEGIAWPAVSQGVGSQLASMLFQLEQSQWWSADAIRERQFEQLTILVRHAFESVPFYRERLLEAGFAPDKPVTEALWTALPLLTRSEIQEHGDSLRSTQVPRAHGNLRKASTSGSTGQALTTYSTDFTHFMWMAFTLRDHLWHARDFSATMASIRYYPPTTTRGAPPDGTIGPDWGAPVSLLYESGPAATLSVTADSAVQAAWLETQDPDYLLTHPSNFEVIARYLADSGAELTRLREFRSIGEIVSRAFRDLCRDQFGVPVVDVYSCNEVGYIALQCPDCQQYHVQSEGVLCEILNDEGQPCRPGETGRVVVTGLHNFAMPLLRYEVRDFAVAGDPDACARGLPAIRSIVGRRRNMFTLPNGEKRWATGFLRWAELAPIAQVQFVQRAVDHVEARVVPRREFTADDEAVLTRALCEDYGYPLRVTFTYLKELQGHGNGKFEDFISEVD